MGGYLLGKWGNLSYPRYMTKLKDDFTIRSDHNYYVVFTLSSRYKTNHEQTMINYEGMIYDCIVDMINQITPNDTIIIV